MWAMTAAESQRLSPTVIGTLDAIHLATAFLWQETEVRKTRQMCLSHRHRLPEREGCAGRAEGAVRRTEAKRSPKQPDPPEERGWGTPS